MHVVAIRHCGGDEEERARRLASITKAPLPAARARVRGRGPKLVATARDRREAERLCAALSEQGFDPLAFDAADARLAADRISPRTFAPAPDSLWGLLADGRSWSCRFEEVRLVVYGARFERIALKRPGIGPENSGRYRWDRAQPRDVVHWTEEGAPFLRVFAPGMPDLALVEQNLSYEGLGAAMRPGRAANFESLADLLRAGCVNATFDDRLRTPDGQAETLGGLLDPHRFVDVAVLLLARALGARPGPYR